MPLTRARSKVEKSLALLWGCELNWSNPSYTFHPLEDGNGDHKLMLHLICLGEKSNDDVTIVEIISPPSEDGKQRPPVPIATLKPSVLPMVNISGMELTPPITFHLRCGSGPVYISGHDLTVNLDHSWKEVEGNEEEENEEEEEEEEIEEEDEDDDDDDIDDDDDNDDDVDDDDNDNDEEEEEEEEEEEDSNERALDEISPFKPGKRLASKSQTGVAKKKKLDEKQRASSPRIPEMKAKSKKANSKSKK